MFIGVAAVDAKDTVLFINTNQITSFVIKTRELTMSDGFTYELTLDSFNMVLDILRENGMKW